MTPVDLWFEWFCFLGILWTLMGLSPINCWKCGVPLFSINRPAPKKQKGLTLRRQWKPHSNQSKAIANEMGPGHISDPVSFFWNYGSVRFLLMNFSVDTGHCFGLRVFQWNMAGFADSIFRGKRISEAKITGFEDSKPETQNLKPLKLFMANLS